MNIYATHFILYDYLSENVVRYSFIQFNFSVSNFFLLAFTAFLLLRALRHTVSHIQREKSHKININI